MINELRSMFSGDTVPSGSPSHFTILASAKTRRLLQNVIDYGKLNQEVVLVTATMPGGISLLEQIKTDLARGI